MPAYVLRLTYSGWVTTVTRGQARAVVRREA
jgi:hypothetical protein